MPAEMLFDVGERCSVRKGANTSKIICMILKTESFVIVQWTVLMIIADTTISNAGIRVLISTVEVVDFGSLVRRTAESRFIRGTDAVHTAIVDSIVRQTDEIVTVNRQTLAMTRWTVEQRWVVTVHLVLTISTVPDLVASSVDVVAGPVFAVSFVRHRAFVDQDGPEFSEAIADRRKREMSLTELDFREFIVTSISIR